MFKFILFCTLVVCTLSAPTEKPSETETTDTLSEEKSLEDSSVVKIAAIRFPLTEKREKRENIPVATSSADNKRTSGPSQLDYQENKPPTFVYPVPVDQIIKNSNASPQIHSIKHNGDEQANSEEQQKNVNHDDSTEDHKPKYNKKTAFKTNEDHSHENN